MVAFHAAVRKADEKVDTDFDVPDRSALRDVDARSGSMRTTDPSKWFFEVRHIVDNVRSYLDLPQFRALLWWLVFACVRERRRGASSKETNKLIDSGISRGSCIAEAARWFPASPLG